MKKQNQNEQTNQSPPPQKYPTKPKQKKPHGQDSQCRHSNYWIFLIIMASTYMLKFPFCNMAKLIPHYMTGTREEPEYEDKSAGAYKGCNCYVT